MKIFPNATKKILVATGCVALALLAWFFGGPQCSYGQIQLVDDPYKENRASAFIMRCGRSNMNSAAVALSSHGGEGGAWNPSFWGSKRPRPNIFICEGGKSISVRWIKRNAPHAFMPGTWPIPETLIISTDCEPRPENPQITLQTVYSDGIKIEYEFKGGS
jgi:hypothetical protein